MTKPKIFISYTSDDRDWATALAKALEDQGARVWIDRDQILPGDSWKEGIEQGLRTSDWIVFLLRADDHPRPSLLFEMGAAVGMGKRLVPVIPEELEPSKLPFPLRVRQALLKESPEETARKLMAVAAGHTAISSK